MFKILLASLLLVIPTQGFAQVERDQLFTQLSHKQADTARLKTLLQLGEFYLSYNNKKDHLDSAELYLNRVIVLATATHRNYEINKSYFRLGDVYLLRNNLPVAERYFGLVAQSYKQDTLKRALTWFRFGGAILRKLTDNGKKSSDTAVQKAEIYYNRGRQLLRKIKDTAALINEEKNVAGYYRAMGNNQLYKKQLLAITKTFENSRFTQINSLYVNLSDIYRYEGNDNISLFYSLKAMSRMDRLRDTDSRQVVYGELALVYDELGQADNAIKWYKKTLEIREKMPHADPAGLYRTAGFMAIDLNKKGRSAEGLSYITGLEKRHPPQNDDVRGMIAQVKAYCYDGLKQYKLAEKYYLLMVSYYKDTKVFYLAAFGKYDIANFYVRQKKYSKAANYLIQIRREDFEIWRIRNVELMHFKIDSAAGKLFPAIEHYQRYKQLNDSIFNAAKSKQIEELQIKYATDQKENDIKALKKDRQLQDEKIKQANRMRNLTFIGIGLLLMVIGLLYNIYLINQKKTKEIDLKNISLNNLVAEKDGLLAEKEWLIKEIHHRVKNNLQIVMGLLQRQSSFIDNKEALVAIQNSEYRMHAIALIHQKLYQADSLTTINMADYIDEMMGYLRDSFDLGTRIQFEKQIEPVNLDVNMAVPLALILNEAITNAIKYAFTLNEKGWISISLTQTGKDLYLLQIADNGKGLPAGFDSQKTYTLGFSLMRGLSKQVGGDFSVVNDAGVTINITFQPNQHIV